MSVAEIAAVNAGKEIGRGVSRARAEFFGMQVDALTEDEALAAIGERIAAKESTWVLTPNLDILRHYKKFPKLRGLFHAERNGADILLADGMPLVWASRLSGRRPQVPQRVAGSTLALSLAAAAAERGWKLFLLGGAEGAADNSAAILQRRHPGLKIAGTHCPPVGFEKEPVQLQAIEQMLRITQPDLVYVALGFPKQELLIQQLRETLPGATFVGVGISLSFIAGTVSRAPRWAQGAGLEWAHRLIQEPRRLAKRYLLQDLPFALFVLFPHAFAARFKRDARPRGVSGSEEFNGSTQASRNSQARNNA